MGVHIRGSHHRFKGRKNEREGAVQLLGEDKIKENTTYEGNGR